MKKMILFATAVLGATSLSYAQDIIKPAKELATVGKTVERTVAKEVLKSAENYSPVFGYTNTLSIDFANVYPVTSANIHQLDFGPNGLLIQTAPILNPVTSPLRYLQAFSHTKNISTPRLAEGFYLYWLAQPDEVLSLVRRPEDILLTEGYTASFLHEIHWRLEQRPQSILTTEELPSLQFLEYLQEPYIPVKSYAELAAIYKNAYPKHVTINEEGIPVKTEESKAARILDNYLMLSNRKQLGAFNNASQGANYTPFILTRAEHAAANELLKSRLQNEQIPANPFADDLIEIAYNRLESHTIPYTQAAEAGAGYKAYPNYKNTALYRTIQGMIEGQEPDVFIDTYHRILKNDDITHLIVLDAIMGGVELTDLKHADRALRAFDEFTADLEDTPENIAHVQVLQQNLRIVFEPYIEYNRNMPYNSIDDKYVVGGHAHELLDMTKARNLVGRNWK